MRETIGKYRVIRELGHGAMGTVFLGEDDSIGRQVAIKTIRTDSVEGTIFHGEHGRVLMSRNQFSVDPPELLDHPPDRALADVWKGTGIVARPHLQNWLDCIKSRQTPHAPVEAGHRTVTICHSANIARELRRPLRWDPVQERFPDDDEANGRLARPRGKGFELPSIS